MMKYLLLLLIQAVILQCCLGQQDSMVFIQANWKVKKIARGIHLKQCWFDHSLFGSSQNISILEIKLNNRNRLDIEADPKVLKPTSAFGIEHDALAAVNGTFFDMKNGGSEDYIRMDGKELNGTRLNKNNLRIFHQKAAIVTDGKKVSIQKWNGSADWENNLAGEDVMITGPLLVNDHHRTTLDTTSFYTMRHPRSAIALKGNRVLLIAVDGRNQRAAGMTLYELASILQWLKATDGINLDGGGSTTLWINHFPDGGVVNYPSDNKKMEKSPLYKPGTDLDNLAADVQKWDHSGQRPVANVILVNKKK
ncbi:MAG: phosphodiester glycosidase family protein [Chitinophagaceae bacterium]